jgi:sugar phosphate isomerase/epimerase
MLTFNIAADWTLEKIIQVAKKNGYAAIEFRSELKHKHGVELDASPAERREIKKRLEDAYLVASGVGTSCRFDSPSPVERSAMIDRAKHFIELARDIDAPHVRVFGNDIPKDVDRVECVKYVGESLRVLGEFADPLGVNVGLEMHGQFNFWKYTLRAVEIANHPRVAIVYNCDNRDIIGGSIAATYSYVRARIRHIHMHEFTDIYPYGELFGLLKKDGYSGYLSAEITGGPESERIAAYYAALFRELVANA